MSTEEHIRRLPPYTDRPPSSKHTPHKITRYRASISMDAVMEESLKSLVSLETIPFERRVSRRHRRDLYPFATKTTQYRLKLGQSHLYNPVHPRVTFCPWEAWSSWWSTGIAHILPLTLTKFDDRSDLGGSVQVFPSAGWQNPPRVHQLTKQRHDDDLCLSAMFWEGFHRCRVDGFEEADARLDLSTLRPAVALAKSLPKP